VIKKARTTKPRADLEVPRMRYADLGGIEGVLEDVAELIERPFRHPEIYRHLGVEPPKGILLHGPPGCGKTCLAQAIAGELGLPLLKVSAPEVVSGMSGESEGKIRELFEQAKASAPCVLFLDEIDAITPKRETAQREMERRIVAQLLTCLDEVNTSGDPSVLVIGATNRPDALDPALRRAGRFDRELKLSIPDEAARLRMLRVVGGGLRLDGDGIDFEWIARNTPGYVGADLRALCQEAAASAVRRIFSSSCSSPVLSAAISSASPVPVGLVQSAVAIKRVDFEAALRKVQPSAKREGFAVVPDTTWADIGALAYIRDELRMAVVEPIRNAGKFAAAGISAPAGVLLWGPPGCGKTLLAKAVANESHSNFISVKGPELLNKYVGESERAVRQVFERARASAPCIVFFDELDAICPKRSEESDASARVVNQLLTELDGLEGRKQVFILAATNRPDIIDPAMTRPGRLDKLLYVQLPTAEDRSDILQAVSRKTPWDPSVDLRAVAHDPRCEHFSGADLAALVREAAMAAVREAIQASADDPSASMQVDQGPELVVTAGHLEAAFAKVFRSVKPDDIRAYERLLATLQS
jgi:ribosome biogenesis ATPase